MSISILSSIWLGILTSISPCPLATNIASISFMSKNISNPTKTIIFGILYTLGRIATYTILSIIITSSFLNTPILANFLQEHINKIIVPIFILIGLVLLDIIKINFSINILKDNFIKKLSTTSIISSFLFGFLLALSFCPVSAALFFGNLINSAIDIKSNIIMSIFYGIGTGLPVIFFSIIIAFSIHKIGEIYNNIIKLEVFIRKFTGLTVILIAIYLVYINYF